MFLSRKPATVRLTDRTGKTALHYCAENQNNTCMEQILDLAPELLEQPDNEGYTPLHLAVIAGNSNIIRFILKKTTCSPLNKLWPPEIFSLGGLPSNILVFGLKSLLCRNHVTNFYLIVRYLLGNKANVDCKDKELHSAVHWAVVCGQLEALDVLCNSGALVNSPDIHGAFPLHYAAQMCGPTDASSSDTKAW